MKSICLTVICSGSAALASYYATIQGKSVSASEIRTHALILTGPGGSEVRLEGTRYGFDVSSKRSPQAKIKVQFLSGNITNFDLVTPGSTAALSVGDVAMFGLTYSKDKQQNDATMWAGGSGGAATFRSVTNDQALSIDTQDPHGVTLKLRQLKKERPRIELEVTRAGPRISEVKDSGSAP